MLITAALFAFSMLGQRAPLPAPVVVPPKVDRLPALEFPVTPIPVPTPEYLNWSGFGFLKGDRVVVNEFPVVGDWSSFQKAYVAPGPDAVLWHAKFVIFTRGEVLKREKNGVVRFVRGQLLPADVDRIKGDIVRFGAIVAIASQGKAKLVPDVTVEDEPLRFDAVSPQGSSEPIHQYMRARVNGGSYQAEDGVFRGPYQSVFAIHPTPWFRYTEDHVFTSPIPLVARTPLSIIPISSYPDYDVTGATTQALFASWANDLRDRALGQSFGIEGYWIWGGLDSPRRYVIGGDWASVALGPDAPIEAIFARLKAPPMPPAPISSDQPPLGFVTPNVEYRIESDPDRGQVLTYIEKGSSRTGGLSFPRRSDRAEVAITSDADTISFWARSSSNDPLALHLSGRTDNAHPVELVLGDPYLAEQVSLKVIPFVSDGRWQHVSVNLAQLGLKDVMGISLGPPSGSNQDERRSLGPIVYSFADFQITKGGEPTPPLPHVETDLERAARVAAMKPSAELLTYFKDPSDVVKLNAILTYTKEADPTAEAALITAASTNYNTYVAKAAILALGTLHTPGAIDELKHLVRVGLSDPIRGAAAEELAKSKDPKLAADFITFLDNRSREAKLSAIRALGMLPGKEAGLIRMTFLFQTDPEIKLAVTETADPTDEGQMRKMLWSVVNEPSDAVRALSAIKLIQCSNEEFKAEGYKAVKDDSTGVRLEVLDWLAKHPSEAHRGAFRLAVADRSPRVRAAALRGFASLEKGATLEEIANTLKDLHPDVQLALLALSKARKLELPAETLESMKASPDIRVKQAVGAS